MTWGNWYWPIALIVVSVTISGLFFPAEFFALFTNHQNTLSDFARYHLDLQTAFGKRTTLHTVAWWASFVSWILIAPGMVVWLTGHIWFDTWG